MVPVCSVGSSDPDGTIFVFMRADVDIDADDIDVLLGLLLLLGRLIVLAIAFPALSRLHKTISGGT